MGNSNSSTRASKKRKVSEEGDALTVDLKNDTPSHELGRKLDQSCLQMEHMTQTMQNIQKQMASMQKVLGDIRKIDTKYVKDQMPKIAESMSTMHKKLNRAEARLKWLERMSYGPCAVGLASAWLELMSYGPCAVGLASGCPVST